jgi:hypothetical protein
MTYTELGMAAAIISLLLSHVLLERRISVLHANINLLAEKLFVTAKVVVSTADSVDEHRKRLEDDGK